VKEKTNGPAAQNKNDGGTGRLIEEQPKLNNPYQLR
jgi:hypothetical protein